MPDETEPLLRSAAAPTYAAVASGSSPAAGQSTTYLKPRAEALLTELRTVSDGASIPGQLVPDVEPDAELAVLLYAIHLLQAPEKVPSIRRALANATVNQRLFELVADEVEILLDMGGTRQEEETEEDLEWIFWARWPITSDVEASGEQTGDAVNAIDLLLPPYTRGTSPFWSHSLLHHVLLHTWNEGTCLASGGGKARGPTAVYRRLKQNITPRRIHVLELISFLFLLGLTMAIAMRPAYLTPYDISSRISGSEIAWIVMSISELLSILQPGSTAVRQAFVLPTYGALLLSPLAPAASYTLLTWSIVPLTTLLVLPFPPSLVFLAPGTASLPLSAMLIQLLQRGSTAGGLLLPLMLVTFGVFTWAMNGDIFRAFFSQPTTTLLPQAVSLSEPIEDGIAPFEARISLFVTFALLLLLALILTIARAIQPPTHIDTQIKRWRGGVRPEDKWEMDFGSRIARSARQRLALGLRHYRPRARSLPKTAIHVPPQGGEVENGHTPTSGHALKPCDRFRIVVPLNILVLPLDIARIIFALLPHTRRISTSIDGFREALAACIIGSLCTCLRILGI